MKNFHFFNKNALKKIYIRKKVKQKLLISLIAFFLTLLLFILPIYLTVPQTDLLTINTDKNTVKLNQNAPEKKKETEELAKEIPQEIFSSFDFTSLKQKNAQALNFDFLKNQQLNPRLSLSPIYPTIQNELGLSTSNAGNTLSTPSLNKYIQANKLDTKPELIYAPKPLYPFEADDIKGEIIVIDVHLLINKKGHVVKVDVVKSEYSHLFEKSILQTLIHWRFMPNTRNNIPVQWQARLPIQFKRE